MSLPKPNSGAPPATATSYNTPPALIAFTLAVVVLCLVGFSIVYFCRCYFVSVIHTWAFHRTASGTVVRLSPNAGSPFRGLDPSLLQNFPTFPYSSVKDLRKDKYSLECAICLLEFEEDSMLRLLTVCCHVFHQECIDLWLQSHKTCPVCRTDLDSPPTNEERKSQEDNHGVEVEDRRVSLTGDDMVCIDVKDEDERARVDQRHEEAVSVSKSIQREDRFARSHSTGHSILLVRGGGGGDEQGKDDDKYTLRLPEHVQIKILRRGGHNSTKSCSSYREMTGPAPPCPCSTSNCGHVQKVSGFSSRGHTENV